MAYKINCNPNFICCLLLYQIRAYLLSTGFSLAFGAMFAKTYRVHRIFTRSCAGVVKNKVHNYAALKSSICGSILAIIYTESNTHSSKCKGH